MSISDRYRDLVEEVRDLGRHLGKELGEAHPEERRLVGRALELLAELQEQVGEIPRMRLESRLTPVLLKAHGRLDKARLLFEEHGAEDHAAAVWDQQLRIYRLLNDL